MQERIYRRIIAETAYVLVSTAIGTTVVLNYPEHFGLAMGFVFGARAAFDLGRLVQKRALSSHHLLVRVCSE
ncbi:MAG: hypothetical protein HY711_11575 [Candidatus Melainabacteria bacterium]|nr:hypothetical protein [Candidatus Melainabacteria bacterium]